MNLAEEMREISNKIAIEESKNVYAKVDAAIRERAQRGYYSIEMWFRTTSDNKEHIVFQYVENEERYWITKYDDMVEYVRIFEAHYVEQGFHVEHDVNDYLYNGRAYKMKISWQKEMSRNSNKR